MKKIFDKEKLFFFIRKPRFALVISVCIVILGIISILSLKQESYPDVTPPQVSVSASYQGASAEVIESSVATVLENKLNGVENLSYMTSTSYDGSFIPAFSHASLSLIPCIESFMLILHSYIHIHI